MKLIKKKGTCNQNWGNVSFKKISIWSWLRRKLWFSLENILQMERFWNQPISPELSHKRNENVIKKTTIMPMVRTYLTIGMIRVPSVSRIIFLNNRQIVTEIVCYMTTKIATLWTSLKKRYAQHTKKNCKGTSTVLFQKSKHISKWIHIREMTSVRLTQRLVKTHKYIYSNKMRFDGRNFRVQSWP